MKRLLIGFIAIAATMAFMTPSYAAVGKFHDGPYTSSTSDSGTCGNDWALDLYARRFTANLPANGDGTYTVLERFTKGHFSTFAGQSPGACQASTHGATVKEGVTGLFHGSFTIIVSNGTFDANGSCVKTDGQCTTAGWVEGFFGATATYDIPQFHFVYTASGQGLILTQWINADTGNSGDIANA
jgi:hypothetical protein